MSTPKLSKLWDKVKEYGYNVRSKNLDGLASWNVIKKELIKNNAIGKWNIKIVGIYGFMKTKLGIKEEQCEINEKDEKIQKEIWEKYHFYLQHARIPVLNFEEPRLYRLMQVAYNAGQLKALFNDEFYTKDMKEYYADSKLSDMDSYMDDVYLMQIENSIDDELIENINIILTEQNSIGGHYELKYYKYKAKYLKKNR